MLLAAIERDRRLVLALHAVGSKQSKDDAAMVSERITITETEAAMAGQQAEEPEIETGGGDDEELSPEEIAAFEAELAELDGSGGSSSGGGGGGGGADAAAAGTKPPPVLEQADFAASGPDEPSSPLVQLKTLESDLEEATAGAEEAYSRSDVDTAMLLLGTAERLKRQVANTKGEIVTQLQLEVESRRCAAEEALGCGDNAAAMLALTECEQKKHELDTFNRQRAGPFPWSDLTSVEQVLTCLPSSHANGSKLVEPHGFAGLPEPEAETEVPARPAAAAVSPPKPPKKLTDKQVTLYGQFETRLKQVRVSNRACAHQLCTPAVHTSCAHQLLTRSQSQHADAHRLGVCSKRSVRRLGRKISKRRAALMRRRRPVRRTDGTSSHCGG